MWLHLYPFVLLIFSPKTAVFFCSEAAFKNTQKTHNDIKSKGHSVLTGCVIIFEMSVTPSPIIKSSINTRRTDMGQMIKHLRQKNSGTIDILRSYMKRIFKLLKS